MLVAASLAVTAERGVRVMSDYLPQKVPRTDEYDRIFGAGAQAGQPTGVCCRRPLHALPGTPRACPVSPVKDSA